VKELGALGCSMAAAIASGVFKDYTEVVAAMVRIKERVQPNLARVEMYRKKYEKHSAICDAFCGVWKIFK